MARRAGWREGARHREQRDALAFEIVAAGGRLRTVGGGNGKGDVGKAVADLDGHFDFLLGADEPQT